MSKIANVDSSFVKAQIDAVRESIGRMIEVHTSNKVACSICLPSGYYDVDNNVSVYFNCPICKGEYWTHIDISTEILARIHWVTDEAATVTAGGKYYLGDANFHVDPIYHDLLQEAQQFHHKVVVDGKNMEIVRIDPVGAPTVNRLRVVIKSTGEKPPA